MTKIEIIEKLNNVPACSAWKKGIIQYTFDIVEILDDDDVIISEKELLNGARDWSEYSYSGNVLIYDTDIAKRLCNPSELRRNKGGILAPNKYENWLDVQARALYQAHMLILSLCKGV